MKSNITQVTQWNAKAGFFKRAGRDIRKNKGVYIMFLPVLLFYIIFMYKPMYGALIAFQNYVPAKGMLGSDWVGFKHFIDFFESYHFTRVFKNTLVISISSLVIGFPAPIILALLLNELKSRKFSRVVQTITYMPHFISLVVVAGMIKDFTSSQGFITEFLVTVFHMERTALLTKPDLFVPIYVLSDVWQSVGWGSIVYLAALSSVDQELYEAARIDGAGHFRQVISITLPCIIPTIVIMFILRMGSVLNVGFEKIILLYNPSTFETADVISSFVYRKGLQERNWSYSTAVGLFNSVINVIMLVSANFLSRKVCDTSLW